MKKLVLLFFACMAMSCAKEENLTSTCNLQNISATSLRLSEITNTYTLNPTKENCELYKEALTNYLNSVDGCPQVNINEIIAAKKRASELDCM